MISSICYSGEGSQPSGTSEDTTLSNMARAVQVHPDANQVMYFAWGGPGHLYEDLKALSFSLVFMQI